MIRRLTLRIALILLSIGWMTLIFLFSGEGSMKSSEMSGGVTKTVQRTFFQEWESLSSKEYDDHMSGLHFFIRKTAHFMEFLILGVLLSGTLLSFGIRPVFAFLFSWAAGALYALSDEWHQSFVSGRSSSLFDVLIDCAGVFFGIAVLYAAFFIAAKKRVKAESPLES